jgi:hypothetical protein
MRMPIEYSSSIILGGTPRRGVYQHQGSPGIKGDDDDERKFISRQTLDSHLAPPYTKQRHFAFARD